MTQIILCCDSYERLEDELDRLDPLATMGILVAANLNKVLDLLAQHPDAEIRILENSNRHHVVSLKVFKPE